MVKKGFVLKKKSGLNLKVLVPVFIIGILVLSTIGFILGQNTEQQTEITGGVVKYGGFEFYKTQNDKWVVNVGGKQYLFDYSPDELSSINVPYFVVPDRVYLLFEPVEKDNNMEYAFTKLYSTLSNLGKRAVFACISEENCPDVPIKDCSEDFAFYLKKGVEEEGSVEGRVFIDQNCVVIEGDAVGMSKAVEAVELRILGV